jgi:hypothetical protein
VSVSAFPLQWPVGRPRKPAASRKRATFNRKVSNGSWHEARELSVADALRRLQDELDRIGARYPVISTNLELRLDGFPRSGQRDPDDPGVALYFDLKGKPHCMPCDTYDRVADNIAAIAKHIEATRAIDRFGVATVSEMFAGFQALPAPGTMRPWREVLGWPGANLPDEGTINILWRDLAKKAHPDAGGSHDLMAELNAAKAAALKELGA